MDNFIGDLLNHVFHEVGGMFSRNAPASNGAEAAESNYTIWWILLILFGLFLLVQLILILKKSHKVKKDGKFKPDDLHRVDIIETMFQNRKFYGDEAEELHRIKCDKVTIVADAAGEHVRVNGKTPTTYEKIITLIKDCEKCSNTLHQVIHESNCHPTKLEDNSDWFICDCKAAFF